jgi:hypothetical protein
MNSVYSSLDLFLCRHSSNGVGDFFESKGDIKGHDLQTLVVVLLE